MLKRSVQDGSMQKGFALFVGAFGDTADMSSLSVTENTITSKATIMERCESIKQFIENKDLGYIIELPDFQNGIYGRCHAFIWMSDLKRVKNYIKKHSW